jgi:hypothetical protein
MARHTWHKAPTRQRDIRYTSMTAGARCLLRELDEILADDPTLTTNVSRLAAMVGLDRKTVREGLESIANAGLLQVSKVELGKEGTFYTLAGPQRTPDGPQTNPEPTPNQPPTDPKPAPDKSAKNADHGPASLREERRVEENRAAAISAREPAAAEPVKDLEELEAFWAAKKRRAPPLSPNELAAIREALAIPGATVAGIKATVERVLAKNPDRQVSTFSYFKGAIAEDLARQGLMTAPIPATPSPPSRAGPKKGRIQDRRQYEALQRAGLLDPDDWENIAEFETEAS